MEALSEFLAIVQVGVAPLRKFTYDWSKPLISSSSRAINFLSIPNAPAFLQAKVWLEMPSELTAHRTRRWNIEAEAKRGKNSTAGSSLVLDHVDVIPFQD